MLPIHVKMEKRKEGSIPLIHLYPKGGSHSKMVYYHGWDSSAESSIFRGGIFASYGFDTYLPDALYHGERKDSKVLNTEEDIDWKKLMDIVQTNKEEFGQILDFIQGGRVYVSGHSMGALTVGLLVRDYPVLGGLAFNGSFDFQALADFYKVEEKLQGIDFPMDDLGAYKNKLLYLANGGQDESIPAHQQEGFYKTLLKAGVDSCHFSLFEDVGHVVTTNMMDDGLHYLFSQDPELQK